MDLVKAIASRQLALGIWLLAASFSLPAFAQGSSHATPIDAKTGQPYTSKQYAKAARVICKKLDYFKRDPKTFRVKRPQMCTALPDECANDAEYLYSRGISRYTVQKVMDITPAERFNEQFPAIFEQLLTYSCPASSHAVSDEPFHNVRRNPMKRAVFLGRIDNFFNDFIFKDYEIKVNGQRRLSIDINAVEQVEGQPETIIDYLDKALAPVFSNYLGKATREDLEDLRQMLINRGAVPARDLDCQPDQQIGCEVKQR